MGIQPPWVQLPHEHHEVQHVFHKEFRDGEETRRHVCRQRNNNSTATATATATAITIATCRPTNWH